MTSLEKETIIENLRALYHTNPFVRLLDIVIDDAGPGMAKSHMVVRPELVNMAGYLHGGALETLVDNLCGVAGRTLGKDVVTQNISLSYIKNIKEGDTAHAEVHVLHSGSHTLVMKFDAVSDSGALLCEGNATMFAMRTDENFTNIWDEGSSSLG